MSLEAELFKLINKKMYSEALTLLANNKDININALDEEGRSFFTAAVEKNLSAPKERYTFIEQVLSNPDFKHSNKPKNGLTTTPFEMAIRKDDPTAIDLILKYQEIKDIQVIFGKDKLLYELQVKEIQRTKEQITQKATTSLSDYLDKREQILASLLNVTVLHAIKTDDPSLLQRLADAGAKLHHPLKDKTYAMDLVRQQSDLKVHQWLSKYIKEQISSSPTLFFAADNLARKQKEEEQSIIKKHTEKTRESIKSTFKFYEFPEEKPVGQSEQQQGSGPKK